MLTNLQERTACKGAAPMRACARGHPRCPDASLKHPSDERAWAERRRTWDCGGARCSWQRTVALQIIFNACPRKRLNIDSRYKISMYVFQALCCLFGRANHKCNQRRRLQRRRNVALHHACRSC
eukprot:6185930-Pleurochrysis_carterae.AAC.1